MFDRNKDNRQDKPAEPAAPAVSGNVVSQPSASSGSTNTIATIGATIRIKGDISGDENLRIEGSVEGTVSLAAHELVIGQSGKVVADLTAKTIKVHGNVQGDITGKENVIISSTSQVRGNVVTPRMTLEDGARFKGSIDIDPAAHSGKSSGMDGSVTKLSGGLLDGKTG